MDSKPDSPETPSRGQAHGKHPLFEPLALLLLSLGTVGTAWCSFQAASWSGVSQGLLNRSTSASRRAVASELQSYQVQLLDVLLFSQYINAHVSSNETLSCFYADRFRDEAKVAFEAWIATKPFENAGAPAHPFLTNFYHPRLMAQAQQAESESQSLWQDAGAAGRTARSYVLVTVVLASALFCGGTASKFESPFTRRSVVAFGLLAFAFATQRLVTLPIQL